MLTVRGAGFFILWVTKCAGWKGIRKRLNSLTLAEKSH
jgi:hypothetical protein